MKFTKVYLEKNNPEIFSEYIQSKPTNINNNFLHSQFIDGLKNYGFHLIQTTGDGNCLFRSISYQLNGTEQEYSMIRKDLCDYLFANKNKYYLDFNVIDSNEELGNLSREEIIQLKGKQYDDYLEKMKRDKEYGDGLCLNALSMMLHKNLNLILFEKNKFVTVKINENFDKNSNIYLFFHQAHYSTLRKCHTSSIRITRI